MGFRFGKRKIWYEPDRPGPRRLTCQVTGVARYYGMGTMGRMGQDSEGCLVLLRYSRCRVWIESEQEESNSTPDPARATLKVCGLLAMGEPE